MTLGGADEMLRRIQQQTARMKAGARKGRTIAGRHILDVSNKHVPHEEGDLERDGAVVEDETRTAITYGRDAEVAGYAERQHDDLTLRHDAGRNAKFLENALNSERQVTAEIIAKSAREGWLG